MKKANDQKTVQALEEIISHIRAQYSDLQLVTDPSIADELGAEARQHVIVAERGAHAAHLFIGDEVH